MKRGKKVFAAILVMILMLSMGMTASATEQVQEGTEQEVAGNADTELSEEER